MTWPSRRTEGCWRLIPTKLNFIADWVRLCCGRRKFPEAQQEFVAALKLKPALGEAYGDLAFAASENSDYPLVIRALDARVKLLPEIPITYFLRASAYDHLRDFKKAAVNYHLFLKTANGKYPDQEWQATHRLIAHRAEEVAMTQSLWDRRCGLRESGGF